MIIENLTTLTQRLNTIELNHHPQEPNRPRPLARDPHHMGNQHNDDPIDLDSSYKD